MVLDHVQHDTGGKSGNIIFGDLRRGNRTINVERRSEKDATVWSMPLRTVAVNEVRCGTIHDVESVSFLALLVVTKSLLHSGAAYVDKGVCNFPQS